MPLSTQDESTGKSQSSYNHLTNVMSLAAYYLSPILIWLLDKPGPKV